jgi:ADP-ribosylglycohydrolase
MPGLSRLPDALCIQAKAQDSGGDGAVAGILDSSGGVSSHWQQRITAALTLAVYADGLAAAVTDTGDSAVPVTQSGPQAHSHAAAQLFCVAAHLTAHHGDLAEDVLAHDLAAMPWPEAQGQAASGTQQVLSQISAGIPWWRAAPAHRGAQAFHGIDVAVRAIAAGLLPAVPISVAAQLARRSAMVTNTHPLVLDAAAVTAAAVALATASDPAELIDAEKFLAELTTVCRTPEMRCQLTDVAQLAAGGNLACHAPELVVDHRVDTLAALALGMFVRCPRAPLQAIRAVVGFGPRLSPAAIITAAIGGAANPHSRPPLPWLLDTSRRDLIATASAGLASSFPRGMRAHAHHT